MRSALLCLLLALMPVATASADELTFKNGDRLTGSVVNLVDGKLTFKSALAGTVTVGIGDLRSFTTEGPVKVILKDGSTVQLPVRAGAADGRVAVGDREVAFADIQVINPAKSRWEGNATLGFSSIHSSTDTNNLSFQLGVKRETKTTLTDIQANYQFSREDEHTTANTAFLGGDYNFGRQNRLYGYVNGSLKHDAVQHLDLRSILGGGVGYQWVRSPGFNFRTEGGISWVREDFSNASTSSKLALRLGYLLDKQLWKNGLLKHDLFFYPKFSDFGDYYLITTVGIEQSLAGSWYANAKVIYDYTSMPAPDVKKSTSQFIVGLGKRF
jgi:putative salt-induced outer membrane protein YdiY